MRKIIDPFTDYLPHLDLHGETTATIVYLIEAFIRDNVKLKNGDLTMVAPTILKYMDIACPPEMKDTDILFVDETLEKEN